MALQVFPLEEADLPTYARIHFAAFRSGISPFLNPADTTASEKQFAQSQRDVLLNDPTAFFLKVVDRTTREIVACAKWHHFDKERSPEEVVKANIPPPPPDGVNTEAWTDFFGWLSEAKTKYRAGQRCWCEFSMI